MEELTLLCDGSKGRRASSSDVAVVNFAVVNFAVVKFAGNIEMPETDGSDLLSVVAFVQI